VTAKTFLIIFHALAALFFGIGILLLVLPSPRVSAFPPMDSTPVSNDLKNPKTLKDPCEKQPNNLLKNGGMGPDQHDTPYGSVADQWNPFVVAGSPPQFRVVNNEGIDGISQQIFGGDAFDAGVLQTVYGTQPGVYYWVRLGWAPAARTSGTDNVESQSVGRQVGMDPYGGTDPKSPNVVWGPSFFGDIKGLNRIQDIVLIPARADHVTVYLRAIAKDAAGGGNESRVWLDALCMEPRSDLATATPAAPPTPTGVTAAPVPTSRPSATRPPPTRALRSPTPTAHPSATREDPTEIAFVPLATLTRAAPNQSIRARPTVAAQGVSLNDIDSDTLMNLGFGSIGGSIFFFVTGLILARYAFR
jgi:hypothetical protein